MSRARDIADGTLNSADINGGNIDNTTIGGTDPAAGTFTTFTSTGITDNAVSTALTIDASGSVTIDGTVIPSDSVLVKNTNVLVQTVSVAENASFSRTYDIDYEGSAKVMVTYGSRDTAGTKLYTEGFVVAGDGVASYFETVAGDKTSTNTGTISISVSGSSSDFTVEKTAGSTSSGGYITIMIISNNVTQA